MYIWCVLSKNVHDFYYKIPWRNYIMKSAQVRDISSWLCNSDFTSLCPGFSRFTIKPTLSCGTTTICFFVARNGLIVWAYSHRVTRKSSCVKGQEATACAVSCLWHALSRRGDGRKEVLWPDWGTPYPRENLEPETTGVSPPPEKDLVLKTRNQSVGVPLLSPVNRHTLVKTVPSPSLQEVMTNDINDALSSVTSCWTASPIIIVVVVIRTKWTNLNKGTKRRMVQPQRD